MIGKVFFTVVISTVRFLLTGVVENEIINRFRFSGSKTNNIIQYAKRYNTND